MRVRLDCAAFIDGSLYDEPRRFARRAGFGIALVATDGALIGYGSGVPPTWIHDSVGAEIWSFYQASWLCPFVPCVVTGCFVLLETLRGGPRAATADQALGHDREQPRWRLCRRCR